jgi:hypothetical protein
MEATQDVSTHHDLWAGINLKIDNASFHLEAMGRVLEPPEQTHMNVVQESSGAIIGGNWHRAFYAHLDAFLSAARSVPELIRCCFGVDYHYLMKAWFDSLDANEKTRRHEFDDKFKAAYGDFRSLPLGTARHISEHRTGFPPVTATVSGRFGITYTGGPIKRIPTSELRDMPPELGWMAKSIAVRPTWSDFDIDGKPLFDTCRNYLARAGDLFARARALADEVHGTSKLTWPPSDL